MYKCQCDQYKKATHLTKFGVEVDDHCIVPQTGSVWIPISALVLWVIRSSSSIFMYNGYLTIK